MTTVDIDGDDAADGLVALVVAVVEILVEALEREAIRRMESGRLTDGEIDRLGRRLAAIEDELDRLKADQGVEEGVEEFRGQLDGLVRDALDTLHEPRRGRTAGRPADAGGAGASGRDGEGPVEHDDVSDRYGSGGDALDPSDRRARSRGDRDDG